MENFSTGPSGAYQIGGFQFEPFDRPPWPKGLRLYLPYLLCWIAFSALAGAYLVYMWIHASPAYINDTGNGLGLALAMVGIFFMALWLGLIIQGLSAVVLGWLVVRRSEKGWILLKWFSIFVLAASLLIGFGYAEGNF